MHVPTGYGKGIVARATFRSEIMDTGVVGVDNMYPIYIRVIICASAPETHAPHVHVSTEVLMCPICERKKEATMNTRSDLTGVMATTDYWANDLYPSSRFRPSGVCNNFTGDGLCSPCIFKGPGRPGVGNQGHKAVRRINCLMLFFLTHPQQSLILRQPSFLLLSFLSTNKGSGYHRRENP